MPFHDMMYTMTQAVFALKHGGPLGFTLFVLLYAIACEDSHGALRQIAAARKR